METDRAAAKQLGSPSPTVGVAFQGVGQVSTGPNNTEVRYFRRRSETRPSASPRACAAGVQGVKVSYIEGYEDATNIRPLHYEIWFAPGAPVEP